jgi:Mg-chelatase subunit ChlD
MTMLTPVWLLLALPLAALWLVRPLPSRLLRLLRAVTLALLLLALARPLLRLPAAGGSVVVLADRSDSMPPEAKRDQAAVIRRLQTAMKPGDLLGVVSFARRSAVEHPLQIGPFAGFTALHETDASQLAGALDAALALLPGDRPARLLVLSDGLATGPDPLASAGRAAGRRVPVDYRVSARAASDDLAIARLEAPLSLPPGEALLFTAWISSPKAGPVAYELRRGNQLVAQGSHPVGHGLSPLVFRDAPPSAGVAAYTLTLKTDPDDPCPENNRARFLVRAEGPRPLLVVPATPESALPDLLRRAGFDVTVRRPEEVRPDLAEFAGVSGMIIENTRADALGTPVLDTIAAWIQSGGGGLILTGGRNSYGQGGYFKSALDPLLPVSMELRREHRKYAMAIVVVLDRSGSMTAPVSGGRTKMDLANLGGAQVLDLLQDQDEFGVIAVDSQPHTVVPRLPAGQARSRRNAILRIASEGGGIFVYDGLNAACRMLQGAETGIRHIILFADAADAEQPGDYVNLLAAATASGISVSVIGLGTPADVDADFIKDVALRGHGDCYFTDDAAEIPRLFAQDTFAVSRSAFITNAVAARVTPALPLMTAFRPETAPVLGGYNLCYLKPDALAAAVSKDENEAPLIAFWRRGTGRVLAYAGEADGAFTGPLAAWPQAGDWFAAMARWTVGAEGDALHGYLPVLTPIPGGLRIALHGEPERITEWEQDRPVLHVLRHRAGRQPQAETIPLPWSGPDVLSVELEAGGDETLLATVSVPGEPPVTLPPWQPPYSPEYAPRADRDGAAVLAGIAAATGGRSRADPASIWDDLPRQSRPVALAPVLYLLAALVFLLEVFERWTGWLANRARFRRMTAEAAPPVPVPAGKTSVPRRSVQGTPPPPEAPSPEPAPPQPTADPIADALNRARKRARDRM